MARSRYLHESGLIATELIDEEKFILFCCSVRSGAPIDLSLHFALRFSETYPVAPPKLVLFTNLPHPNVFARAASAAAASSSTKSSDDDGVGYYYACLDMLEASQNKPYLGWSSSYTVSAILLQIHGMH